MATVTDPLSEEAQRTDVKGKAVRGGAYLVLGRAVLLVIRTLAVAVLARLLVPGDFGLVAMVTALTGFLALLPDAGLAMSTVQRATINRNQLSTLFWFNALAGVVLAILTCLLAPVVAWFYNEPRLLLITVSIAASFSLAGLGVQHRALLMRNMRFGMLTMVDIISLVIACIAAIAAAAGGAGYWALVVLPVSQTACTTVGYWLASGWRPGLPKRGSGVRQMLAFGGFLSLSRVLNYAVRNLDNVLIGYYLGPAALGIYSRAYDLLLLPMNQLSAPLISVGIPALSRLQNSPEEFRRYYLRGIELAGFLGIGIVALTFAATEEIVAVFLGPKWMEAVPVFRALAPAAVLGSLNVTTGWLFVPLGRTGRQFVTVLFGAIVMTIGLFIGIQWGIIGVAVSVSAAIALFRGPQVWFATLNTPIRTGDLMSAVWCPAVTATAASLFVLFAKTWYQGEPILTLIASTVLFLCVYTGLVVLVPRGRKFLKRTMHLTRELKIGRGTVPANS